LKKKIKNKLTESKRRILQVIGIEGAAATIAVKIFKKAKLKKNIFLRNPVQKNKI